MDHAPESPVPNDVAPSRPVARHGRVLCVAVVAVLCTSAVGCSGSSEPAGPAPSSSGGADGGATNVRGTFFGWVEGPQEATAIAFDVDPDAAGAPTFSAFVCDGMGLPSGVASWFTGSAATAAPPATPSPVRVSAAGGGATLVIEAFTPQSIEGSFAGINGATHRFVAHPATDGAGIYDITLGQDLAYAGTSTRGATLAATVTKDGAITASLGTSTGRTLDVVLRSLPSTPPDELARRGHSARYAQFAGEDQGEGAYVAIVAPGGTRWLGRGGDVRTGSPSAAVLALAA